MKVLVAVKRVPDAAVTVRVRADGSGVDLDNVRMSMNPFDEIALEEAIRLRERGVATEVLAQGAEEQGRQAQSHGHSSSVAVGGGTSSWPTFQRHSYSLQPPGKSPRASRCSMSRW